MTLYSRVYGEQPSGVTDSDKMRKRIFAFFRGIYDVTSHADDILQSINREIGCSSGIRDSVGSSYTYIESTREIESIFSKSETLDFMDVLCVISAYLSAYFGMDQKMRWTGSVERVFREEGAAYTMDSDGMVHPYVDAPFAEHRALTLKGLQGPRYATVRVRYEQAYEALRADRQDTRTAVRDMFAALECLALLMVEGLARLDANGVTKELAPLCCKGETEAHAQDFIKGMLRGLREWVNAHHQYRHEQGVEEPAPPSQDMAVLSLATGSGFLRFLATIDRARSGSIDT